MRIYFLAERPCALTIGGAYLGLIDGFERSVELASSDILCEIAPLGDFLPLRFCLDDGFFLDPPPEIRLYYTEKAVAVFASDFLRADQSLKVLWQTRTADSRLTLTCQGKWTLNLENETGFHLIELPEALSDCTAEPVKDGILLRGKEAFMLLSRAGERLLFSEGNVLSAGETIRAEVPFRDSLGHVAVCEWREGKLVSCAVRSLREPSEATFALALFESVLIGADAAPFLSEELLPKADKLKEYLGDFTSVVLTPEPDKIGLCFQRKERVFDVRYFRVTLKEGKISNIIPL